MTDRLRSLLGQLAEDQPVVHDWPARVRQSVRVRRQRQRLGVAAVALVVVAGTGIGLLASGPAEQDALIGSADPSPSASPSAVPSREPSAQPSAVATAAAMTPRPAPVPSPSVQEAEPAPSPTPLPTYPQQGSQDIEISARTTPERPVAGQEWVLEVTVTGFADSEPYLQQPCIEGEMCQYVTPGCPGPPEGQSQSPPPARPQRVERTFRHTFPEPGRYDVKLEASSMCSYYVGRDELLLVVEVGETQPGPTPSTAASPSPS